MNVNKKNDIKESLRYIIQREIDKHSPMIEPPHNTRGSSNTNKYNPGVANPNKRTKRDMASIERVLKDDFVISDTGIVKNGSKNYVEHIKPHVILIGSVIVFVALGAIPALVTAVGSVLFIVALVKFYNYQLTKLTDITYSDLPHKEIDSFLNWESGDVIQIHGLFQKHIKSRVRYKGVTNEGYIVVHPLHNPEELIRMSPKFMNRVFKSNKDMAERVKENIDYTDNRYSQWLDSYKEAKRDIEEHGGQPEQMRRTRE